MSKAFTFIVAFFMVYVCIPRGKIVNIFLNEIWKRSYAIIILIQIFIFKIVISTPISIFYFLSLLTVSFMNIDWKGFEWYSITMWICKHVHGNHIALKERKNVEEEDVIHLQNSKGGKRWNIKNANMKTFHRTYKRFIMFTKV